MKIIFYIGFIINIILLEINFQSYAQVECPVAIYYLNGSAVDSMWHHYNGILYGTASATDRFGNLNSAISFNGLYSYIALPNSFDMPERTLNLWFLADNIGSGGQTIYVSDCNSLLYGKTSLTVNSIGGNKIYFNAGGAYFSCPINENQWYMATISVGTDSTRFYLDGILLSTQLTGTAHSTYGICQTILGANQDITSNYFSGKIDQLFIEQCVLSPSDLNDIIKNELKLTSLSIFPNPANTSVRVVINGIKKEYIVSIYDQQGQLKYYKNEYSQDIQIDLSSFKSGIYLLEISNGSGYIISKILKD